MIGTNRQRRGHRVPLAATLMLAASGLALASDARLEKGDTRTRAVDMYDEGRYAEARPLFEELDAAGKADGPVLYRLAFCLGASGDHAAEQRMLDRALAALETEAPASGNLEAPFYLANAYVNLGRAGDARRVAAETVARVESGALPKPTSCLEMFRLGKLHADQGSESEATRWFRAAVDGFGAEAQRFPAYRGWARRYLAQVAFSRADFAEAEREYSEVAALGSASVTDLRNLAVARVRLGRFGGAAEAWRDAERLDPSNADDPRYARHLALQAETLGSLPATDPAGRPWNGLSRDQLETVLSEQAQVARDAVSRARTAESGSTPDRATLAESLRAAHAAFVAAGLEYAARGLPVRETAFRSGYAPLIFHPEGWDPPTPPAPSPPE